MRRRFLSGLAMLAIMPATALADDDHDRARAAVEAGEIRPLTQLLTEVERRFIGQVVDTELDRDDDRWIYNFKLLPPSGRMYRVQVDARTGVVLRTHGPAQERR
jgi:uncharacterized membrane protein YkoI